MSNVIQIAGLISNRVCAEGSDFFELLGPVVIFGIYIVASIIKTVAKKNSGETDEEAQSALKESIEKRRQEIYQRQVGKTPPKTSPQYTPVPTAEKPSVARRDEVTLQDLQQRKTQQRLANIVDQQSRRRDSFTAPKQKEDLQKYKPAQESRPRQVSHKAVRSAATKPGMHHKTVPAKTPHKPSECWSQNQLLSMIRQSDSLRSAIILKEILDKPLALRE